jgi:hypothetical protein
MQSLFIYWAVTCNSVHVFAMQVGVVSIVRWVLLWLGALLLWTANNKHPGVRYKQLLMVLFHKYSTVLVGGYRYPKPRH